MAEEQIEDLKAKLLAGQKDFENYKVQCKQLEEYLEQEIKKKDAEIRKLKEEAINKEKATKLLKAQVGQLQTEVATLKVEIDSKANDDVKVNVDEINELREKMTMLQGNVKQLETNLNEKEMEIASKTKENDITKYKLAQLELENEQNIIKTSLLKKQIVDLKDEKQSNSLSKSPKPTKKPTKKEQSLNESQPQPDRNEQKLRKCEQSIVRYEKQLKDLKQKNSYLTEENRSLQSRLMQALLKTKENILFQQSDEDIKEFGKKGSPGRQGRLACYCIMLTKQHYISPFLVQDKNCLKIYKSTKNGCFEKSLGSMKHKFNSIVYDYGPLLEQIVSKIIDSSTMTEHSIIIFGVKKSTKKYIMAELVTRLKDFLVDRLEQNGSGQALYMKRSIEEEKNAYMEANDKESIFELIEQVIGLGIKNDKKGQVKKGHSKPKVRYFCVKIGELSIEIVTSSHTSINFRDRNTQVEMLNHIVYSKLPNILQSSTSQKHLILTLNPIVDLYEECRNTLSASLPRTTTQISQQEIDWHQSSPVRGQLSEMAKRKIQSFQRQTQMSSMRIKRLQQECRYYKHKFDQLEYRLKNLINTHQSQNSYLKKSPVMLSYERMLAFVHNVQLKTPPNNQFTNSPGIRIKHGGEDENDSIEAC